MSKPQQIQVPPQMLQQLLRGPTPAQKPPDVVEVMSHGERFCFNMDAVEVVLEDGAGCKLKLKGDQHWAPVSMKYDEFLYAAKIQPRQLYAETDSGD